MKKFFDTLFKSLNPDAYSKLSIREFSEAFKYFFSVLFLAFVFMIILALPMISKMPQDISNSLNEFYQFEFDFKVDTKTPVAFPENNPKIIIDTTGKYTEVNNTKAKILITQSIVSKKEGLCFWAEPLCFRDSHSDYQINDYTDAIQNRDLYGKVFTLVFIAALPVFLIVFYFVFVIKYLLLALAASIIIFSLLLLLKHHTMYPVAFKIALYSTTILAVLEIALAPVFSLGYYSLGIYIVFNLIATYLASAHMIDDE